MKLLTQDLQSMSEADEDKLPVLVPVFSGIGANDLTLFIGNAVAADDAHLLRQHGITSTINVAVNIEPLPLILADGTVVRRTQIGLIDGPGNLPHHLLSAVFALHGIAGQKSPGKSHYPPHRTGHILVHCRGGRSRSASVIALYLHLTQTQRFTTFEDALAHVRTCRGLDETQPQKAMLDLSRQAIALCHDMKPGNPKACRFLD
jgi:myo-inositol-1(or 4)-monophosphatase